MKLIQPAASTIDCPSCTAVVCAYNEEKTLANIVRALAESPRFETVIVLDDGSSDGTPEVIQHLQGWPKVNALRLEPNRGKGYAMAEGLLRAKTELVLFVDADLHNWKESYVEDLLRPLALNQSDMVIGYPMGAQQRWEASDPLGLLHWISGQRAVRRAEILPLAEAMRESRLGVETLINVFYLRQHRRVSLIRLNDLVHPIKFQKDPLPVALKGYLSELGEIVQTFQRILLPDLRAGLQRLRQQFS